MKINRIILENFKCFENEEFELSAPYTLIIGDNGKGKTAILDAIAVGISALLSEIKESDSSRSLLDDDVRLARNKDDQITSIGEQYPVSVTCEGIVETEEITWKQSLADKGLEVKTDETINTLSQNLNKIVSNGQNCLLPLIAYYGTDRLWIPKQKKKQNKDKNNAVKESRNKGYENCFHPDSNVTWLIDWLGEEEDKALDLGKRSDALEVVTSAIAECMEDEDWQTITYDLNQSEVLAEAKDGRLLPLRLLSDGVRNMLAMVADMAYRAAMLNPHLGKDAAKETPGIVLIDEIDLHLHPSWQRGVVEALHRTFPKIQFIATTHSPFIIQSLRRKLAKLISLDAEAQIEFDEYDNEPIEDIVEDVMGVEVPQQSDRYQKMEAAAKEYLQLLEDSKNSDSVKLQEIEEKLNQLIRPYSDDPAYEAFLERKKLVAGFGKEATK
jgi:predicted ATP-binding protein involved in virulence